MPSQTVNQLKKLIFTPMFSKFNLPRTRDSIIPSKVLEEFLRRAEVVVLCWRSVRALLEDC